MCECLYECIVHSFSLDILYSTRKYASFVLVVSSSYLFAKERKKRARLRSFIYSLALVESFDALVTAPLTLALGHTAVSYRFLPIVLTEDASFVVDGLTCRTAMNMVLMAIVVRFGLPIVEEKIFGVALAAAACRFNLYWY
jgi:hypothetical protein